MYCKLFILTGITISALIMTVQQMKYASSLNSMGQSGAGQSGEKKSVAGLPSEGVFSFGRHEGYLQLPAGYTADKKYPFILFFHGRGGSAQSNNFNCNEFKTFREICHKKGFIVAVPAYGPNSWLNENGEKIVLEMLDFLQDRLSINPERLYVMGCSMGGASALIFTIHHPEKVKAVCDVFGVTDYVRFYNNGFYNKSIKKAYGGTPAEKPDYYAERSAVNHIDVLKNKPVLVIHGDRDIRVPKWNSDDLVKKLKTANADVEYIVVPGLGHRNAIIKGLENKVIDFFEKYR
jgi:dipeptidyl aminopeptidase/acylaminoacyl peptidase